MSFRRFFSISSWAVFIVLSVAVAGRASVNVGFQPISPEELKMTSEPLAPGAPAIILFREVWTDDNGRTSHEDSYFRIKILTEAGRKYADVEIPYDRRSGSIGGIHARTISPDGTVVNFQGKAFDKSIVKAKGVKYMAKIFTLPDVQVGSIIEYYYTEDLHDYWIFNAHWILSHELFTKSARFAMKPYQNDNDPLYLRWSTQLAPGMPQPQEGPDKLIRLEVNNVAAFPIEDLMPPEDELKARVNFIYSEEPFETEADKYWSKSGKKLNGQLETFVGKRKAMQQAVAEIVSPNDAAAVKLQKIYARVQQLRNTSYETEKTEQEEERDKEKRARNCEDVWKSGYGDHRQLNWLFLALARAAGFEAEGVWASDREHYFFAPVTMESNRLDAAVVLVKLNGKEVYFDPGSAFTPFGSLPWEETGAQGLCLDNNGGAWVTTSLPEATDSRIERRANLKLSDTGGLEGKLTVTFTGLEAHWRRLEERQATEAGRKKFLEDEVKGFIPAGSDIELVNRPEWTSSAPSLVAEFNLTVPGWASGAGHRALFPVGLFSASEQHLFDHVARVHPIYLQFPSQKLDDVTIDLPPGWQVSSLPPGQSNLGHVVQFVLKVENQGGRLHLTRDLNVNFLGLPVKYYAALRLFFQTVKNADEEQVVLQPGKTTASN